MNFAGVKSITIPEGDVKSVAIGGVTVWTKPNPLPYDAEVEYIRSDSENNAYIDTGVSPVASTFGLDIDFSVGGASCPQRPFGCRASSTTAGRGSYNVLFATEWNCRIDMIGTSTWAVPMASGSKNGLVATPSGVTVNGEYKANVSGKTDCEFHFLLFAINNAGSPWKNTRGQVSIYRCKIYQGSAIVRDFIPVRVGTAGYLYDRANPTGGPSGNGLYGSATSTPLVAGPDKN